MNAPIDKIRQNSLLFFLPVIEYNRMKKSVKITATALCALAVTSAAALMPTTASAEGETVGLTPITADADIAYHYFASPTDVYADAEGIVVSEADKLDFITRDTDGYKLNSTLPVAAQKTARLGGFLITLENGVLNCRYGANSESLQSKGILDFCVANDKVYALDADGITSVGVNDTLFDEDSIARIELRFGGNAQMIAFCGERFFLVTDSAFANKSDICSLDVETGDVSPVMRQSDKILSVTAMSHSNVLYTLTRDAVRGYAVSGGGLAERYSVRDGRLTDIYAFDGFLYGLDTLDALYRINAELGGESAFTPVMASANDSLGFFNTPSAAYAKNSALYVADTVNDRIVAYTDGGVKNIGDFDRPVAVACDSSGTLYVAYAYNKLSVISRTGTLEYFTDGGIKALAVNADKRIFVSASDGLYTDDGDKLKKIGGTYNALAVSAGKDELYALTDDSVVKLAYENDALTQTRVCSANYDTYSLAVDLEGSVYMLTRDSIIKTRADGNAVAYSPELDGKRYTLGSSGHILLGTIANEYVPYGCAVIVDTDRHRIFTADGSADGLAVKLVDGDYETPDPLDNEPIAAKSGLIRIALYDTPVFSVPAETPPVYTIGAGRKVIVAEYTLDEQREYSYVYVDDIKNGKLVSGYVYKDALSAPLPYTDPQNAVGAVFANATPVYKWPSQNSVSLRDYGAVKRGTNFTVMPFVNPYRDDYGNLWLRVDIENGCDGYVLAKNMSLGNYEPTFIRPAYNAEIISYKGSESAPAFELVDGEYLPLSVTLATGTRIEVVGAFDTSKQYTQVKYLDAELGTLTCYVPTEYVKYNGVNVVPIVAVVVIAITLVLAGIIIGRVVYLNRKRLTGNPNQKSDDEFDDRT